MYYNNIYEFKNTKMTYNLEQEYYLQVKEKNTFTLSTELNYLHTSIIGYVLIIQLFVIEVFLRFIFKNLVELKSLT
jgi:hypothetical protein